MLEDGPSIELYMQRLSGGPPIRLTNIDSEPLQVVQYVWSRDGTKLAITRQRYRDTDVVAFSNFR